MFNFLIINSFLDISFAHWLVIISSILILSGVIAYIRDILKGKSKPNLVTWGLWALGPMIATGAALSVDADPWATLRIFISGFGPLLIFLAGIFFSESYWKLSLFDYTCGALSLVALGVWFLADSPLLAILFAAIGDLFATLPTIIKAWQHPETETLYTYFTGFFTAIVIIPSIPVWNIANSAFQIYLIIANTFLFFIVLRGYFLKRLSQR